MSDTENLEDFTEPINHDLHGLTLHTSESRQNSKSILKDTIASPNDNHGSRYHIEEEKESSLQRELESVRNINKVIENVLSSLECAKRNMDNVSRTVNSASTLLDTWVRILSQTEHNQRLILNRNWKGATADIASVENESVLRAQAEERKAADEEKRKEDSKRREEEERQRHAGNSARGTRGSYSRPRGLMKRGNSVSSGYSVGGPSGTQVSRRGSQLGRTGSGIGKGLGFSRGRLRGTR